MEAVISSETSANIYQASRCNTSEESHHFNIILLYTPILLNDVFLSGFPTIFYTCLISPKRPSHPPWFDLPNNSWWRVQIMELLIMQFYLSSCYFLSTFKYYLEHSVITHSGTKYLSMSSATILCLEIYKYYRIAWFLLISSCSVPFSSMNNAVRP
jgi:hypothetical protein